MTVSKKEELKRIAWTHMDEATVQMAHKFGRGYMEFLDNAKTEREAVTYIAQMARKKKYVDFNEVKQIKAGQKLFINYKDKVCALLVMGQEPLEEGVNIIASHIDAPRLDLKARPLYEADNVALFKTHYYGGIKKYQWVGMPLALHGVAIRKDGQKLYFKLGENPGDIVFTIADLLPHLAKDQMEKKLSEAIKGEDLNILVGSQPDTDAEGDAIKKRILRLLKEQYQMEEDDFTSAEFEAVPAFPAREIGFDRSMIGAYGQDDRVSAYTSLQAVLDIEKPRRTAICLFVDKEEIGSTGNTGLQSLIIENMMAELMHKTGQADYYYVRKALASSNAISADVNAAVDPNYPEVFEKLNCSFLSQGVVMTKFTGSRGKADSNDAHPEYLARLRRVFDEEGVIWQVGELGKVDLGGGGTVAQYMARYGMEVVDCGVALLGMHSPFEVASKADIYMAYKAYKAFWQKI
jgi:aspartyl aminopeptidase